jgi:hypothetical protein
MIKNLSSLIPQPANNLIFLFQKESKNEILWTYVLKIKNKGYMITIGKNISLICYSQQSKESYNFIRLFQKTNIVILRKAKNLIFFFSNQKVKRGDPSAFVLRMAKKT